MPRAVRLLVCSGCLLLVGGSQLRPSQQGRLDGSRPVVPSVDVKVPLAADGGDSRRSGHQAETERSADLPNNNLASGRFALPGLPTSARSIASSIVGLFQLALGAPAPPSSDERKLESLQPHQTTTVAPDGELMISEGHHFLMAYWGSVGLFGALSYFLWYPRMHHQLKEVNLNGNAYSLVLLAAVKQATLGGSEEVVFKPTTALMFCGAVSIFQITLVYLLVAGINPYSLAVAEKPAADWMTPEHLQTVSAMKWLMAFVLVLKTTGEVEESKTVMRVSMEILRGRLCCSRWVPFIAGLMQYVVSLMIVYAGCAAVLSFQQTPDIVYSGLAVCFVADVDDLCYQYFTVTARRIECKGDIALEVVEGNNWRVSGWYHYFLRILSFLPGLVAFYVVGRAFLTGNTPVRFLHRNGLTPQVPDF